MPGLGRERWQAAAEPQTFSSGRGRAYLMLGHALRAEGKPGEARAAFALALKHLEPSLGPDHPDTREARRLAAVQIAQ